MTELRKDLPELPDRMKSLPVDERGYPVPHFVAWIKGDDGIARPDFRIVLQETAVQCWNRRLCWICGQPLGRTVAFVIGPMCAINRNSSEPPQHRECAIFAAKACPFLTRPRAKRRAIGDEIRTEHGLKQPAGVMIERNPGVTLVWMTRNASVHRVDNGVLFHVGDPVETIWFAEGKPATREQVDESINSGLPILYSAAAQDGGDALRMLERAIARAQAILPPAV